MVQATLALSLAALTFIAVPPTARAEAQEAGTGDSVTDATASGRALFDQKRYAEALEQLDAALADGQREGRLLYMAARCQQETRKGRATVLRTVTEAMPLLQNAATTGTPELIDHAFLADAYVLVGNAPSARQAATDGVAAFSAGKLGEFATMDPVSLQRLGEMAILAQDWELSARALDRVVEQAGSDDEEGALAAAQALSSLGKGQLAAGQAGVAADSLKRSLELDSDDTDTQVIYARALFHDGQYGASADQWREVRMSDVHLANDATYAAMAMRTLAQKEKLQAPDKPLEDLGGANGGDLEQKMLEIAGEMNALSAGLPPEMVKRGYADRDTDDATRTQMKSFRDLKLRLAWVAAAYVDQGLALRDFAFARGLQGYLREWRLPKARDQGDYEMLPLEWLNETQRAEYVEKEKKRAERRAARAKKEADGS